MEIFIVALALILIPHSVESGGHALIQSEYSQLVTSSTLRWQHAYASSPVPAEAVPSGTGNQALVICRAEHGGVLIVGTTIKSGECAVGFVNKMFKMRKFEVLINIDRAAKLEWVRYDPFSIPVGAVSGSDDTHSSEKQFIGRHLSPTGIWFPGRVEVAEGSPLYSFGVMKVWNDDEKLEEHSTGDILKEVEPVRYELEINPTRKSPKLSQTDVVLAKSSLFRFDEGRDQQARLQKVLAYEYDKSEYYGQVPGMVRALPTSIHLSSGRLQSILWGMPENSRQSETLMVGHLLRHHSAVDVSIVGVRITEELPYTGTLTTVFPDGSRRQRHVQGTLQRKYLDNIRPEYSRVYRIKESVAAPVQTTTSTTTTTVKSFSSRDNRVSSESRSKEWMMADQDKSQMLQNGATDTAAKLLSVATAIFFTLFLM